MVLPPLGLRTRCLARVTGVALWLRIPRPGSNHGLMVGVIYQCHVPTG